MGFEVEDFEVWVRREERIEGLWVGVFGSCFGGFMLKRWSTANGVLDSIS